MGPAPLPSEQPWFFENKNIFGNIEMIVPQFLWLVNRDGFELA